MSITTGPRRIETQAQMLARVDARNARIEAAPHYVYKAFDSFGILLYIGCTMDVAKRRAQHAGSSQWSRFAETLACWGPYSKDEARRLEREAIDTEASYFNATVADINRTNANRVAATRALAARGCPRPNFMDFDPEADYTEEDEEAESWYALRTREQARLKETTHPYLTDRDRLARYLVARHDAALAMAEQAAP